MELQTKHDRLLAWCMGFAAVAVALLVIVIREDQPPTSLNAFIDGARFVAAVAAVWFGSILVIERRLRRSITPTPARQSTLATMAHPVVPVSEPVPVIDLREPAPVTDSSSDSLARVDVTR